MSAFLFISTIRIVSHPAAFAVLARLRVIGIVEGVSYLLLLFIAMPLKYMAGIEEAVRYVGWAHGLLFMLFVAAVGHAALVRRWTPGRTAWALLSSIIPFGTFVLDVQLRREREELAASLASR